MGTGLYKLATIRTRIASEGLRASTAIKTAQASNNVTAGAPSNIGGTPKPTPVTSAVPKAMVRPLLDRVNNNREAYVGHAERLVDQSPQAVVARDPQFFKSEASQVLKTTPGLPGQVGKEIGGAQGIGLRALSAWRNSDSHVRANPWATAGRTVMQAADSSNPINVGRAVFNGFRGVSAVTGAGDAALNTGIDYGVNEAVDRFTAQPGQPLVAIPQHYQDVAKAGVRSGFQNIGLSRGMLDDATTAISANTGVKPFLNKYQADFDPQVNQFIKQNPQTVGPATRAAIQDRAMEGNTGAIAAREMDAVINAVGGGDFIPKQVAAKYGPAAYQAWREGRPMPGAGAPVAAKPGPAGESGMAKLMKAIDFNFDQRQGYAGSFLNGANNGKFRWGAGGIGLMALLWLMSRMGRK